MKRLIGRLWDRVRAGGAVGQTGCTTGGKAPEPDSDGFGVPQDTALSGWFDAQAGELFRGFPIRRHDRVLDVGCGDSPFARFCTRQGATVIYTDIDTEKVRDTRQALRDIPDDRSSPLVSDCARLPLRDASVDKIISLEVLEHVDDPTAFMGELVRAGKPGARYLISVPDPVIENLQKKGLAPEVYFSKPNHIRIWEHEAFADLVVNAGLEIESRECFGFYWAMWWVFFWACRQDLAPPWHPLLKSWTTTWTTLLETEDGARIKRVLDDFMPKSQLIIARKPQS